MGSSRLWRLFCIALVGGFLAGALLTMLLRWRRRAAVPRPVIIIAEVIS